MAPDIAICHSCNQIVILVQFAHWSGAIIVFDEGADESNKIITFGRILMLFRIENIGAFYAFL
jgi:hypothetical protein